MSQDQSLIERIVRIEELDRFPNRSRDKVVVKALEEKNGQIHYELTVTRKGVISVADVPN